MADKEILVELDGRNRASLGRLAGPHRRFLARVDPGGVIILMPATVVPLGAPAGAAERARTEAEKLPTVGGWTEPAPGLLVGPVELRACGSGQCTRKVGGSSTYCCAPCREAWESTPRYEPHHHSEGCEQRHRERTGEPDPTDNIGTGGGVTAGPPSAWLNAVDDDRYFTSDEWYSPLDFERDDR